MIYLQQCIDFTSKLLGTQNYNEKFSYRLLNFCEKLYVSEGILLYNNLTKELVLFEHEEWEQLKKSNFTEPVELAINLVNHYFLVKKDNNDIKLADQMRTMAHFFNRIDGINSYTILTTTGCNARCFYCFEEGTPIYNMDKKTAEDVAEYILNNYNPNKKINFRWFGGEPLCNCNAIDIICSTLRNSSVEYVSEIVSNGYLFNEELIEHAVKEWNLKTVQITLDGCKETYNKVKNYVNNDANAFDRVTNNIELLCKNNVNVTIRLNLDMHNIIELFSLVDWIGERYNKYHNISVYARPLFENTTDSNYMRSSSERHELTEKFIKLQEYIKKLGLYHFGKIDKTILINCCQADSYNSVLISPEGKLGRCEHHVNDDFYGSIYNNAPRKPWTEYCKQDVKCATCVAYPTCLRLKGCHNHREECYDYEKYIKVSLIQNGMLKVYNKYIKEIYNVEERNDYKFS